MWKGERLKLNTDIGFPVAIVVEEERVQEECVVDNLVFEFCLQFRIHDDSGGGRPDGAVVDFCEPSS